MNDRPDLERLVTDWLRAEAPARAPDRVLALALDRVAVVGQEHSLTQWRFSDRSGTSRMTLIAATAALLVLLAAVAFIGSQIREEVRPAPIPPPAAPVVPPAPPVRQATRVGSGTATTDLGTLDWIAVEGDATNIPSSRIFETPGGFAAIEPNLDRAASRFWVSTDGLTWATVPLPVPATGAVNHAVAAGEHWIWSSRDMRTWRSADFVTWTEVDLAGLGPPTIDGVEWEFFSGGPVTAGSTTLMPWTVIGNLALEELLGVTLPPGETLVMEYQRDVPALGDQRVISRVPMTIIGPDTETRARVGSIQVELDGTVVTVTDAEREIVLSEIDATTIGADPATLADELNRFGFIRGPGTGALITQGGAQSLPSPPDLAFLTALDDRFVAITEDRLGAPGARLTWTSTDGLDWESLGPPEFPARPAVFQVDPRPAATRIGP